RRSVKCAHNLHDYDVRYRSRLCKNPIDAMIPLLNRGGMMKGFVQGADRQQTTLLPECLDDWVDESNPVRAVDVFIDALELRELGFDGVTPAATGRPGDHPSPMLKLYIYGYLNRVQSSRRLKEKLIKLEEEVKRLKAIEKVMLAAPDQQVSFTDPDSRSMATSGRGSGM